MEDAKALPESAEAAELAGRYVQEGKFKPSLAGQAPIRKRPGQYRPNGGSAQGPPEWWPAQAEGGASKAAARSVFPSMRHSETGFFPEPSKALGHYEAEPASPEAGEAAAGVRDASPLVFDWLSGKGSKGQRAAGGEVAGKESGVGGDAARPQYTTDERVLEYTTLDALRREAHKVAKAEAAAEAAAAGAPPSRPKSAWGSARLAAKHHAALSKPRSPPPRPTNAPRDQLLAGAFREPPSAVMAAADKAAESAAPLLAREWSGVGDRLMHQLLVEREGRREAEAEASLARAEKAALEAKLTEERAAAEARAAEAEVAAQRQALDCQMRLQRDGLDADVAARAAANQATRDAESDPVQLEVRRLEVLLFDKLDARAKEDTETARCAALMRLFRAHHGRERERFATRSEFVWTMRQLGLWADKSEVLVHGKDGKKTTPEEGGPGDRAGATGGPLHRMFEAHAERRGGAGGEAGGELLVELEAFYRRVARTATRPGQRSVAASEAAWYMDNIQRVLDARQRPAPPTVFNAVRPSGAKPK